jgi:hypothetical protein
MPHAAPPAPDPGKTAPVKTAQKNRLSGMYPKSLSAVKYPINQYCPFPAVLPETDVTICCAGKSVFLLQTGRLSCNLGIRHEQQRAEHTDDDDIADESEDC